MPIPVVAARTGGSYTRPTVSTEKRCRTSGTIADFDEGGDRPSHRGASPAEQGSSEQGPPVVLGPGGIHGLPRGESHRLESSTQSEEHRTAGPRTTAPSMPPPCTERSTVPCSRVRDWDGSKTPVSPNDRCPRRSRAIAAPARTPGATGLAMPNATTPSAELAKRCGRLVDLLCGRLSGFGTAAHEQSPAWSPARLAELLPCRAPAHRKGRGLGNTVAGRRILDGIERYVPSATRTEERYPCLVSSSGP